MTKYTTKLLSCPRELEPITARWNELRQRQPRPSLELHPDWLMLEARSKPGAIAAAIALYEGAELVGVAPFLIRPWQWKCRLAYASVASFPVRLASLCGGTFIAPDDPEAHDVILKAIAERDLPCDMIYFDDVPVDSHLFRRIHDPGTPGAGLWRVLPAEPQLHWLIRMAPTFEEYLAKFSSKRRCKLRNDNRRIEKHARAPIWVEEVSAPERIPAFLEHVERVSAASWQGTRLKAVAQNTPEEREKWIAHAARGWVRSYLLMSGDECVAFVIGAQRDGIYRYERIGYVPEWAPFRPGTVLLYHVLEALHARSRPDWFDFGTGDAEYKQLYGNESYATVNLYLVRPSAYMGVARAVHGSLGAIENVVRRSVRRLGLRTEVMRLLRRGRARTQEPPAPAVEER